jgi:hypothetical protein
VIMHPPVMVLELTNGFPWCAQGHVRERGVLWAERHDERQHWGLGLQVGQDPMEVSMMPL